jgi:membrane-bound lytic murein transglycosylase D
MAAPVRALALFLLASAGAGALGPLRARAESFPMPGGVAPRVEFWTRVYTEVGTNGGFIHDNEDLSLVYEVVRVPEGASERTLDAQVDAAKARARAALRKLGAGQRSNLSASERRVLATFPPNVSSQTLRAAAERVRFQRGQANKFRDGLRRQGRWESYIRQALREQGVPEDLKALPHVESSYNTDAHSHAGAAGLWQFTRPTGRLYMRVDHIVDERRDPFHASQSAARLLRNNYERLGTWPLAITAYNHGPGGLARAVRQLGTRDIGTITARYRSPSFGFASRNFYAEFLAARRIDQNPERYFGPIRRDPPADHESVVLKKSYGAGALAQALRIPSSELRAWNPALLSPVWNGSRSVPASYEVRLPRRAGHPAASRLVAGVQGQGYRGAPVLASRPGSAGSGGVHRVARGETLGEIAARHGTSSAELAALNGIRNPRHLREGQVLELPGAAVAAADAVPAQPAAGPSELAQAEPAEPELREPGPARRAAPAEIATLHRVARGETLVEIARRYEVPMAQIAARNAIRDPRDIAEGQTLEIPAATRRSEPASELARAEPAARAVDPPAAEAPDAAASAAAPSGAEPPAAERLAAAPAAEEPRSAAPARPPESPRAEAPAVQPPSPDPAAGEPPGAEPASEPAVAEAPAARRHTVAAGDTLASIARQHGVSAASLAAANGVDDPRRLRPGQELAIPADGAEPARSAPRAPAPERYRVRAGDTLGSIARRTGISASRLAAENGIDDPRRLRPGQVLVLPGGAPAPERYYTVRAGDTLYSIAARHGVRVADLARRNGLRDRHKLSIGQRLELPPERSARSGAPAAEGS